jgi:uncharacterized protein DUF1236
MNTKLLAGIAIAAALSFPVASNAQDRAAPGVTTGLASNTEPGEVDGGVAARFHPFFHRYVDELRIPSYRVDGEVRVGQELPSNQITYYDLPSYFGVTKYRFTVVNERNVLVDPTTNRIVQVIE